MVDRIEVLVIDDQEAIRQLYDELLAAAPHIVIRHLASTSQDGLIWLGERVSGEMPHVCIVQMKMRRKSSDRGAGLIRKMRRDYKDLRVLAVSLVVDEECAKEAKEAGAHGYVSKENLAKIIEAVEAVAAERT